MLETLRVSQKGRFSREPRYGRRIARDPREKVSQNSFSFLISQKAVAPMSYECDEVAIFPTGATHLRGKPMRSHAARMSVPLFPSPKPAIPLLAKNRNSN